MATPADAAAQARILKHMNADHGESLSLYLQHYASVPAAQARSARLTSITRTAMTIEDASGAAHEIRVEPALRSWADARTAAVRMDREARSGLGLDGVVVARYIGPRGLHAVVFALAGLTALSILFRGRIVAGTAVWAVLERWFPGGAGMFLWLNGCVAWPMLVVHVGEAMYFARKVSQYGVVAGSRLWWAWVGSCAIEGMGAMFRFSAEVERLRVEGKGH